MPELTLDSEHIYSFDGKVVPGVTEVIKAAGLMKGADWYTDFGRDRGRAVHVACELLFWNNLDWETVDERIKPYVESCASWIEATSFKPIRTEHSFYHPGLRFAGTFDAYGHCRYIHHFLFDLKSGNRERWHGVQTALYKEGAEANKLAVANRGTLYLQATGEIAKHHLHEDRNDLKVGLSALKLYQEQQAHLQRIKPYTENIERWMAAA